MNKVIKIKDKLIGEGQSTYIIAEMSANHGGDLNRAIEIIYAAKEAGADCIKIQTSTPDMLTIDCDKDYFKITKGTWKNETLYNLYKKTYTPWEWHKRLKEEAEKIGLHFFSSPFGKEAVDFLEDLGVEFYKIASFEIVDLPLVEYIASKGKPIIMSTGMATLDEIEDAVNLIKEKNNNLALLKCSSAYPAVPNDMNLKTIKYLENKFDLPVGLSDHSFGFIAAVTAVGAGAKIIEKHLCLSRDIETPDSSFSMEPEEFKEMVKNIRIAEKALGKMDFSLSDREKTSRVFRRSIFVVEDIKKGEKFTEENIKIIRPGYGINPKYYKQILGNVAKIDIKKGEPLDWNMVRMNN